MVDLKDWPTSLDDPFTLMGFIFSYKIRYCYKYFLPLPSRSFRSNSLIVGSISDQPSGAAFRLPNFFICGQGDQGSTTLANIITMLTLRRTWQRNSTILQRALFSSSTPVGNSPSPNSPNTPSNDPFPAHDDNTPPSANKYSLVNPLYKFIMKSKLTADPDLGRFLARSAAFSVYGLASMTALGTVGIDTAPLLTGIGITGFTIGFALKEIATNFLSGVMLVFGKPFKKGQYLKVLTTSNQQQLEGEVQSIDARYVLLRTKDRGVVMIPSVVVYTNPILVSNTGNGVSNSSTNTSSTPAKEESKQ